MDKKMHLKKNIDINLMRIIFQKSLRNIIFLTIITIILLSLFLIGGSCIVNNLNNKVIEALSTYNYSHVDYHGKSIESTNGLKAIKIDYEFNLYQNLSILQESLLSSIEMLPIYDIPFLVGNYKIYEMIVPEEFSILYGRYPSNYDEILVSDYFASLYLEYKGNYETDISEILGQELFFKYDNFNINYLKSLKIVGIIKTNCSDYENLNSNELKNLNINFLDLMQSYYNDINQFDSLTIKNELDMESFGFSQFAEFNYLNFYTMEGFQNNQFENFKELIVSINNRKTPIRACSAMSDDEIKLPLSMFLSKEEYSRLLGANDYDGFLENIIKELNLEGKFVIVEDMLSITSLGGFQPSGSFKKDLLITDIFDDYKFPEQIVEISSNNYQNLLEQLRQKSQAISIADYKIDIKYAIELLRNGKITYLNMFFPEIRIIESSFSSLLIYSSILLGISIIFLILFVMLSINTILDICKKQQYNLAVLKMHGYSNIRLLCIVLLPVIFILSIGFLISIFISLIVLHIINNMLVFNLDIVLISLQCPIVLLAIASIIINLLIGVLIGTCKLRKVDPVICLKEK